MAQSRVWHPFTQHALEPSIPEIVLTEGAYLHKADGSRILDAISSWWVVTHGHRHPRIMKAIETTASSLDQIIFAGFTHEPAERLAEALVGLARAGLDRVFYSDSGSTSIEVALKMALGYFRNIGAPRSRIVVMEHSYHGDTIGAMSVGARGVFNAAYEPLLFEVDTIPFPAAGREQETLDRFEALSRDRRAAALIVEPLVLGAGGMLMYPAWVLTELKRITEAAGTLLIADEVMTGWGRTGTMFACEQASVSPDILCTSKGLTGGTIPLAATIATDAIFQAHYSEDRKKTFFHSSSYTANPIACAAALANVEIWHDEPVAERIAALSERQAAGLRRFRDNPRFTDCRTTGTIAAIDLRTGSAGYLAEIGPKLRAFFLERGLLVRPLGNVLYLLPPYCITGNELDGLYDAIEEAGERFGSKP
ncbi:adenosylmethionine--8-amino-7-oxononanoate transaminase [Mesorhizobium mediterraneum]|uniref:Adenosylmethionine-8-amino-7-oxononanoate aminotransferase n=1 Tax=Mesorhizobium mediterraneum TaxID=43617 RepID=A0AB36R8D7_9HYPH|nr:MULTISPECIES: adenosylmethionine--8-amino-7-oxononanoate transaminase [Mesorhizobium]RWN32727.1 MAG: adenosylmethionine--8-amino-7-oxononanoate transaminase [Mesorhizobium sp.]AZO66433.1 adenosylmethionine--8-amino-7-oxononanoate transaminase [Mesorhizobium sp. M6A.T.Cr.TU.016.01.1.1]PAQ00703.1 adenosylmethionine--8-amino-7-oxononanoate transaminase [Mesorhizobium mediterraneum]RUV02839.1 adenosylmethionine--8-amino-7-oxononanoate transaminase [Mesorhizobium sp. M6A.T.Cr.TU.017.01.1.1]WIW55